MSDKSSTPAEREEEDDPVDVWQRAYGDPLLNALKWIAHWRFEERPDIPRELTYQEFSFRAHGYLWFDAGCYRMSSGIAEAIAKMGEPGFLRATGGDKTNANKGPIPRLNYELACHIARTNEQSGGPIPECLRKFSSSDNGDLLRERGGDLEKLLLFKTLSWWAVDRAARLEIQVDRNREPAVGRAGFGRETAAELVSGLFSQAGLGHFTKNSVIEAWEPHKHTGSNDRKLTIKSNYPIYVIRFEEVDKLIGLLPTFLEE